MATKLKTSNLADRIHDKLFPIHRGAIRLGNDRIVAFGNDGVSTERARHLAEKMKAWLARKGWKPSEVVVCDGNYTWAIVATPQPGKANRSNLWQTFKAVWKAWDETKAEGETATDESEAVAIGDHQKKLARAEIEALGGGYTDETLSQSLGGKFNRSWGLHAELKRKVAWAESSGGEDCHVLLGGVPYRAKLIPVVNGNNPFADESTEKEVIGWSAVLLEDVGTPKEVEFPVPSDTATGYFPAGIFLHVTPTGETHATTGLRLMQPTDFK